MTPEMLAADIQRRHNIRSLHIFVQGRDWRVFGARGSQAFQASVEEGRGADIAAALQNLDDRLTAGPINRGEPSPFIEMDCSNEFHSPTADLPVCQHGVRNPRACHVCYPRETGFFVT